MICQLQTEAAQENGSAALLTLQMRLSYTMYCKEGLTASNSSQLPTKASFPENSSPALPLSRLPSPLHHLKQWGTNPQSIWINLHTHTVRYLSVVSRGSRSPASRRTCCGVEEFFWSLSLSVSLFRLVLSIGMLQLWMPALSPAHGRICWFVEVNDSDMSLMQFWTKFYAQLGRPPPKVYSLYIFAFRWRTWHGCCLHVHAVYIHSQSEKFKFDIVRRSWRLAKRSSFSRIVSLKRYEYFVSLSVIGFGAISNDL